MVCLFLVCGFFLFTLTSSSITLQGQGSPTLQPVFTDWFFTYKLLKPDVDIRYTVTTALLELQNYVNGTPTEDFGVIDSNTPTIDQYSQAAIQGFPVLISGLVPVINLPGLPLGRPLVLTRWVLADIFGGTVTNWRDPEILCTNRDIMQYIPNATITVIYRADVVSLNTLWMKALSAFNSIWNATYTPSPIWPPTLKALPNFYGQGSTIQIVGKVVSTPYSIGYCGWTSILRDSPSIQYVSLINKAGVTVSPSQDTISAAMSVAYLDDHLRTVPVVDSPEAGAWPVTSPINFIVSTNPQDCTRAKETYKLLRWILTDPTPQNITSLDGYAPLSKAISSLVMAKLNAIQCDGELISSFEDKGTRNSPIFLFFMSLSVFIFVGVCIVSAVHIHQFRTTQINLVYSVVFVVGSTLTLFSPLIWYSVPSTTSICQARLWLTSLGFTILLGTMFSRTWQLRDIYLLQKRSNVEALKYNVSLRSSLAKLFITISIVLLLNITILLIWTQADPFSAKFGITNNLELQGKWSCTSEYMSTWLGIETAFVLGLILFGVFVIYQTWAFQRKVLMVETRWVLIALYNVVLNIAAIAPFLAIAQIDDLDISLIVMVSIDFSGGGIVLAVLLPRLVEKLEWSTHGSDKGAAADSAGFLVSSQIPPKKKATRTSKMKSVKEKEQSRTPAEELSLRLVQPTSPYPFVEQKEDDLRRPTFPGHMDESLRQDQLELVSLHGVDSSSGQCEKRNGSQEENKDGLQGLMGLSPITSVDSPSLPGRNHSVNEQTSEDGDPSLSWSKNPISDNS